METLDPVLMDELLTDCKTPADVKNLYSQLLQRMINRSLEAELDAHLKYDKGERSDAGQRRSNTRNGKGNKTIKGDKASCRWKHHVTVTAALSQSWCKNAKYGWQGWKNTS